MASCTWTAFFGNILMDGDPEIILKNMGNMVLLTKSFGEAVPGEILIQMGLNVLQDAVIQTRGIFAGCRMFCLRQPG